MQSISQTQHTQPPLFTPQAFQLTAEKNISDTIETNSPYCTLEALMRLRQQLDMAIQAKMFQKEGGTELGMSTAPGILSEKAPTSIAEGKTNQGSSPSSHLLDLETSEEMVKECITEIVPEGTLKPIKLWAHIINEISELSARNIVDIAWFIYGLGFEQCKYSKEVGKRTNSTIQKALDEFSIINYSLYKIEFTGRNSNNATQKKHYEFRQKVHEVFMKKLPEKLPEKERN